jgi:putative transposase
VLIDLRLGDYASQSNDKSRLLSISYPELTLFSPLLSAMSYNLSSGACYKLQMHLVLVTKYRRRVISAAMLKRLEEIFHATCLKWESRIVEFNGESDHVHLIIEYNPKVQISKYVNNLKTVSSRLIRKEFAAELGKVYLKPVFWSGAYFVASCGGVTVEQLKQYVQSQTSPTDA